MRAALFRDNFSPCQSLAVFPSRAGLSAAARSLFHDPRLPPSAWLGSARPGPTRPVGAALGRAVPSRAVPDPPRPGEVPALPVPPAAPPLWPRPAVPGTARLGPAPMGLYGAARFASKRNPADITGSSQNEPRRPRWGTMERGVQNGAENPRGTWPCCWGTGCCGRALQGVLQPRRANPTRPGGIAAPRRCPRPPSVRGCPGLRALPLC